jgi:diphthine synthase
MALSIIGIGLSDEKDITEAGLELVKAADLVFLECYTSILQVSIDRISQFYGKEVLPADRALLETRAEQEILAPAATKNVAVLIVGDPLGATTHHDLVNRARESGIPVRIVHNASVMTAVANTGLSLYKFGKTGSIPIAQPGFSPESFFDVLLENRSINAHTLLLLDLDPPHNRFMTVNDALIRLVGIATRRGIRNFEDTRVVGCARLGTPSESIAYGSIKQLFAHNFGPAPHCLVVPGQLHFAEEEALSRRRV